MCTHAHIHTHNTHTIPWTVKEKLSLVWLMAFTAVHMYTVPLSVGEVFVIVNSKVVPLVTASS